MSKKTIFTFKKTLLTRLEEASKVGKGIFLEIDGKSYLYHVKKDSFKPAYKTAVVEKGGVEFNLLIKGETCSLTKVKNNQEEKSSKKTSEKETKKTKKAKNKKQPKSSKKTKKEKKKSEKIDKKVKPKERKRKKEKR